MLFSYYYDNQEEIEKDIAENEEERVKGTQKIMMKFILMKMFMKILQWL